MKQDINNDFDKEIKSMLKDAEADVPQHLMDDIFSRLDDIDGAGRRRVAVPLWLKWATAGMAAAALALCVLLRHWNGDITPSIPMNVTASLESAKKDLPETDTHITADIPAINTDRHIISGQAADVLPKDVEPTDDTIDAGQQEETITNYYTTDSEGSSNKDEGVSEEKDNADEVIPDIDPFSDQEAPDTKSARRVSISAGGDLLSNGNANGISRFGGSRLPSSVEDATYIEQTSKNSEYAIPLSFGVSAKIKLAKRWYAGVGVNYTLLQRTFNGTYTKIENGEITSIGSDIKHSIHYIGIPVNAYYHILDGSRVKLYAYAGGSIEKGVSNVYKVKDSSMPVSVREKVKGVQMSAGAGIGVEFMLTDQLGLYVNPGVRYFFDCNQPVSIRTQQPFMMDFEAGFRISL